MGIFLSYSNLDGDAVRRLAEDLDDSGQVVWLDQDLKGGDAWWRAILEQIRHCTVFVVALSDNSLRSKPCQTELAYARALGVPVLPVQIGEVSSKRTVDIFEIQLVDYRAPTQRAGIRLATAVGRCAAQRGELPDPLPPPPPIPYEYLFRIGTAAKAPELSPYDQGAAVAELRTALDQEEDDGVRGEIADLLHLLRNRSDVTLRTAGEIDALLPTVIVLDRPSPSPGPGPVGPPGPDRVDDPPGRPPSGVGNRVSLVALTLGVLAVAFYPVVLGPAAFVLAVVAVDRAEPLGRVAAAVALGGLVVGSVVGVLAVGPL